MDTAGLATGTEALRDLFERQARAMVRLAELMLGDRALAEDAVQDAFARLSTRIDSLHDPEAADAYLRAMVVNRCRAFFRRRKVAARHAVAPLEDAGAGDASPADRLAVMSALRHLPRRQRECLVLRYYLDLSEADIATALGISRGSVKTHASRGLAAMGRLLGGDEP